MSQENIKNNLTILVCSCDSYEDLWMPFFTLLKKYWSPLNLPIVFNTETKDFSMDGLNIQCIHSPGEKRYGQRMLNALAAVKTKYVLLLLDDFFLRQPVNEERIHQIISWMESDENIAYFNCDSLKTYMDCEVNKFAGFKRLPPASDYMLNMQAAIWRTEILKGFWRPDASPWEWETMYNLLVLKHPQYKFYCAIRHEDAFLDYGHRAFGDIWGVYRGKWILEDVAPLFEKENIEMDFSIRGIYSKEIGIARKRKTFSDVLQRCKKVCQIRGWYELPLYIGSEIYRIIRVILKNPTEENYFTYILQKERKRFLSSKK